MRSGANCLTVCEIVRYADLIGTELRSRHRSISFRVGLVTGFLSGPDWSQCSGGRVMTQELSRFGLDENEDLHMFCEIHNAGDLRLYDRTHPPADLQLPESMIAPQDLALKPTLAERRPRDLSLPFANVPARWRSARVEGVLPHQRWLNMRPNAL